MINLTQPMNQPWLRILLALVMVGLFTLGLAHPVAAAEFRGGDTVVIGADEVIDDDLFVSGQTVTVDGTVTGNLFAAGEDVTINGTVEGSLFITGRTLATNGAVNGSLYGSGYALTVGPAAAIDRNVYFGGFSLTTAEGSQVGRSLYSGGYQMILNGAVANDVTVGAGALELNGNVGGDVVGNVGSPEGSTPTAFMPAFEGSVPAVPPGLRVNESAQVGGDIVVEITTTDTAAAAPIYSLENGRTRWLIGELIALLLIGGLLLWLRPTWLRRTSTAAQERWLPSLGIGLLAIIGAIILTPLLLGLIILLAMGGGLISFGQLLAPILGIGITGLILAVALFVFLVGLISKIIVALMGGRLLLRQSPTDTRAALDVGALVLGLVIFMALRALPFGIGVVISALVTLLGVGAFFLARRRRAQPDAVTSPVLSDQRRASLA